MYAVVAGVGIPAAFRNITALAMVIAWLFVELVYQLTGDSLPLKFSFMADVMVITAIFAKMVIKCGPKYYPSARDMLRCFITDLTFSDRGILAIFLLGAWPLYVLNVDPWWKWMGLWALVIIQFLLAGAEAAFSFRHDVKPRARSEPPDNGLALAGYWRDG
jgi:hypothetical protein